MEHTDIPAGEIHPPHNWRPANAAERQALAVTAADVGRYAWQLDDNSEWMLIAHEPVQWQRNGADPFDIDLALLYEVGKL